MKQLKNYDFGKILSTNCLKQISSYQKYLILHNHFKLNIYMLSINLFFMSATDSVDLNIFTVALFIVCRMTLCIVLTAQCSYLQRNKYPLVLYITGDKMVCHKISRIPEINYRKSVQKRCYIVSPWNHSKVQSTT